MSSITAKFILEMLGRPADHLTTTLNELITKMGSEKGISVISKEIHKPKPVEKVENLWTAFADIELEFDTLQHFFNAVIMYMPAHVEIVNPDSFKLNAFELNELSNFVVSRLHNYDAVAKKLMGEREILISKLEHLRKGGKIEDVFGTPEQQAEMQRRAQSQANQINQSSQEMPKEKVEDKNKKSKKNKKKKK